MAWTKEQREKHAVGPRAGAACMEESTAARLKRLRRAVCVKPGTGKWLRNVAGMTADEEADDADALLMTAASLEVRGIVGDALKVPPVWGRREATALNTAIRQWTQAKKRIMRRMQIDKDGKREDLGDWTEQLLTKTRRGRGEGED